jgi:hypothetical protein
MPKLTLTNSKTSSISDPAATTTTTATTTPTKVAKVKQLPSKLAKKVKNQFHRLDNALHHVMHRKLHHSTYSVISPSSPIFYPIGVVRAFIPPDQSVTGSVHSRDTWDVKYDDVKYDDVHSLQPSSLANHSIDLDSPSATHIDMSDEHHLPEEPQSDLHEQEPSTSPSVFIEAETPDPFLIDSDEEGDSPSEDEKPSSDAISQQVVSPTQAVPLDLPSSPKASIPQLQTPIPNLYKDTPPPPSESEEEYIPELYVPALIVPTMFLPIPNVRRLFSSNLLTWWLSRNLMYNNNTRPIH